MTSAIAALPPFLAPIPALTLADNDQPRSLGFSIEFANNSLVGPPSPLPKIRLIWRSADNSQLRGDYEIKKGLLHLMRLFDQRAEMLKSCKLPKLTRAKRAMVASVRVNDQEYPAVVVENAVYSFTQRLCFWEKDYAINPGSYFHSLLSYESGHRRESARPDLDYRNFVRFALQVQLDSAFLNSPAADPIFRQRYVARMTMLNERRERQELADRDGERKRRQLRFSTIQARDYLLAVNSLEVHFDTTAEESEGIRACALSSGITDMQTAKALAAANVAPTPGVLLAIGYALVAGIHLGIEMVPGDIVPTLNGWGDRR